MTDNKSLQTQSCIILANGAFPTAKQPIEALRTADFICCCDGAVEKLVTAGFKPDAVIGDGDSITAELRRRFADIFQEISEQEENDLTKATRFCLSKGYRQITYLGATGLREDHTIGNIFLLPFYLQELDIQPTMLTDEGIFQPFSKNNKIKTRAGQQISIFNISSTTMNGIGLRYPISPFSQLWQGTLNEALGNEVTICADGIYLVFRQY